MTSSFVSRNKCRISAFIVQYFHSLVNKSHDALKRVFFLGKRLQKPGLYDIIPPVKGEMRSMGALRFR